PPTVRAHAHVAVGAQRLSPPLEQHARFLAKRAVASGAAHARHAAQELPEDHRARLGAPPAHVLAGRGQPGGAAKALEDVVVGDRAIDLAGPLHLLLEAARQQAHARVLEGLQLWREYWGGPSRGRAAKMDRRPPSSI